MFWVLGAILGAIAAPAVGVAAAVGAVAGAVIGAAASSNSNPKNSTSSAAINAGSGSSTAKTIWVDNEKVREVDLGFDPIPICRPKFIKFKFEGLRPNTRHFFFAAGKDMTNYVSTDSGQINNFNDNTRNSIYRNPGEKYINETGYPTELGGPSGALYSDVYGNLEGIFYLQRNSSLTFATGQIRFKVIDINRNSFENSISFGSAVYTAGGTISYSYTDNYIDGKKEIPNPNYVAPSDSGSSTSKGSTRDNDKEDNGPVYGYRDGDTWHNAYDDKGAKALEEKFANSDADFGSQYGSGYKSGTYGI
jgi:hypothetical protein